MAIPASLQKGLALPVICAPMFIVSNPDLVIAQCKGGLIGSFPALNARPKEALDEWLTRIKTALADDPNAAPFAVNQIIHQSNERLEHDMALCVKHQVPLIITSLRAPDAIVPHVHAYGGQVFHDVISVRHAEKALEAGVDGLILVCTGAGGRQRAGRHRIRNHFLDRSAWISSPPSPRCANASSASRTTSSCPRWATCMRATST